MLVKNRIFDFRKKLGLSQTLFASLLGISKNSISLYETQKMQPSLGVAIGLMHIFNCSFEDIFYIDFVEED